ncbi:hypothetical protein QTP70_027685, partial [Hemibagrus guttatus]
MFLWGASPHDVASVGGVAPPVVSGGEFRQHLAPTLPPLGEFQTPARRTSSPRSHRSSVDVARCECLAVDVARRCCSAVDVAWPCCSAVDVTRLFGLAVGSFAPPTCLAPASHSLHMPRLDPRSPYLPRLGPRFPPLALLLLLAPPPVPRSASRSPHRPLYVPSSSSGLIAGPDFLGRAKNPTTYIEALQLYKKLPSLLRKRENDAVPVKVWLYPLAQLGEKAATLKREIHKTLVTKTESLLEDLGNAETQCNDLITNTTVNDFQDVRRRLKTFQDFLEVYKVMFLKSLHRLIPAIRGGTEQEQALTDIIAIHQKSPFRSEKLNQWLEYSQSECQSPIPPILESPSVFIKKGKWRTAHFSLCPNHLHPQVDVRDRNIILKLQKSPTGSTERFRVEYRTIQATDSAGDVEKWEVKETPDAQENFTLTDIKPPNQYWVRYRAISEVGVGEVSDNVLFLCQGKLKFSVGQNW